MTDYKALASVARLPKMPGSIALIKSINERCGSAVVVGGMSSVGKDGHMCPVVTIINHDKNGAWGWSICIGNPEQEKDEPYFFETAKKTHRGTELPKNEIYYFEAKVTDPTLDKKDASRKALDEIIAYVLPHISKYGPPLPSLEEEDQSS